MPRGGKRKGAGRPKIHPLPTKVIRLPVGEIALVKRFLNNKQFLKLPLFSSKVAAGIPATADDHIEEYLDLNDLVQNPDTTFLVRVYGNSMIEAGIQENDLLIVDRNILPINGKIVIAVLQGQLTVKIFHKKNQQLFLMPANAAFLPIEVKEEDDIHIWGVVTKIIHNV